MKVGPRREGGEFGRTHPRPGCFVDRVNANVVMAVFGRRASKKKKKQHV